MRALTVTYCVITYNRWSDLQRTLEAYRDSSVFERRGHGMILVNNGSPFPNSIASELSSLAGVTVIEAGANLGVAGGRNRCASQAVTDIVVFVDDDLAVDFESLSDQIVTDSSSFTDWTAITYQVVRANGQPHHAETPHRDGISALRHGQRVPYLIGACTAVRRDRFQEEGGFAEDLGSYGMEEIEFSLRVLSRGESLRYSNSLTVVHLKSENGRLPSDEEQLQIACNRVRIAVSYLPAVFAGTHFLAWSGWLAFRARSMRPIARLYRGAFKRVAKAPRLTGSQRWMLALRVRSLGGRVFR